MDPITTSIVAALSAEATQKTVADTYNGVKQLIKTKFDNKNEFIVAIDRLEQKPQSKARQLELQEHVEENQLDKHKDVVELANKLIDEVNGHKNHHDNESKKTRYRIFISYSRKDEEFVKKLNVALEELTHYPEFDTNIEPGAQFSAAIRAMIARSHIFMPIISSSGEESQWVNQETGYAMALHIPILPIGHGENPQAMIQPLHMIKVDDINSIDKDQIKTLLLGDDGKLLDRIARPKPIVPKRQYEITSFQEERTKLLARYTEQVTHLVGNEPLRQMGALSSFCLPAEHISSDIWKARDGINVRSRYYHSLQLRERLAFEEYVRHHGCKLIISPEISFKSKGDNVTAVRLKTLRDFLQQSIKKKMSVEIVATDRVRATNNTIVGNWFVAKARASKPEGYSQTSFNWHGPTVLNEIEDFDRQFEQIKKEYLKQRDGSDGSDGRVKVINHLDRLIRENCGCDNVEHNSKLQRKKTN